MNMLEQDLKPRDVMTRAAFENAMVVVMALGGSTNAVLHLIAMAHAVDIEITLDDFQAVSDKTPFLADLKPSGKYVMEDLHAVGGTPAVLKFLLKVSGKWGRGAGSNPEKKEKAKPSSTQRSAKSRERQFRC